METLYLVDAYGGMNDYSGWCENVGVYSTLEKAIEAGNMYMKTQIEEAKRDPKFANKEMIYEEITLANWKPYRRYNYDSEYDYSGIEIITRELDYGPISDDKHLYSTFC